MANRSFFQMDKTESYHQKTLGTLGKCSANPHLGSNLYIHLIVAYIKHALKSTLSIYEIMQILGISAFDKTPVKELLTDFQVNQNVKEQLDLFSEYF